MQGTNLEQLQDLERCTTLLTELRKGHPLNAVLGQILSVVCQRLGDRNVFGASNIVVGTLMLTRSPSDILSLGWSARDGVHAINTKDSDRGLVRLVRQKRATERVSDLRQHLPDGYISYQDGIRSELGAPIMIGGEAVGAFDVASSKSGGFGQADEIWLSDVASRIGRAFAESASHLFISELAEGKDVDLVLDEILQTALKETGLSNAYAAILVVDGERAISKRAYRVQNGGSSPVDVAGAQEWSTLRGITGRALRNGQVTVVPNVREDPDYFEGPTNIVSEVVIPIRRGSQIIGALDLQAPTLAAFPEEVVDNLKALDEQVSLALYTAQLSETLRREQTILERLAGVAPAVVRYFDPHRVYDLILEAAFSLLPTASSAQILTIQTEPRSGHRYLRLDHTLLAPEDRAPRREPRDGRAGTQQHQHSIEEGVTGQAARTQRTVYVPNVRDLAASAFVKFYDQTQSELAIPLLLGHDVLGVLNIESEELDSFSPRDRLIAELLATEAGFAISNAQDYSRTITLLTAVAEATREVVSTVEDTNNLIDAILAGAMRVTNAEDGYCALILVEDGKLRIERERSEDLLSGRQMEWALDQGLTGRAIQQKSRIYVEDVLQDPAYIKATPRTRSNLVVPLLNRDNEAVGALSLESPVPMAFDEHAQQALEQFGPPVVAALVKNQLVHSLKLRQQETVDLIRQVAHLLRSPVYTLRQGLQEMPKVATRSESARDVETATAFLDLMLGWLEAQAEVLGETKRGERKESVDVRRLVAEAMHAYRYYAHRKEVQLSEAPDGEPVYAVVNREELLGAFVEILANAVKYSPPHGRILVHVDRVFNQVQIAIEDEGKGVVPEDRERIFERGVRGIGAETVKGSGLGLYFVRSALRRQGGDAYVEPHTSPGTQSPVAGSRFILTLPLART